MKVIYRCRERHARGTHEEKGLWKSCKHLANGLHFTVIKTLTVCSVHMLALGPSSGLFSHLVRGWLDPGQSRDKVCDYQPATRQKRGADKALHCKLGSLKTHVRALAGMAQWLVLVAHQWVSGLISSQGCVPGLQIGCLGPRSGRMGSNSHISFSSPLPLHSL